MITIKGPQTLTVIDFSFLSFFRYCEFTIPQIEHKGYLYRTLSNWTISFDVCNLRASHIAKHMQILGASSHLYETDHWPASPCLPFGQWIRRGRYPMEQRWNFRPTVRPSPGPSPFVLGLQPPSSQALSPLREPLPPMDRQKFPL